MMPRGAYFANFFPTLVLYLTFLLLGGWGNCAIGADKVLNVGIYENPPKVFLDKDGNPSGIFVDLLNQIASIKDWQINYHHYTWNECFTKLEDGSIDLLTDVAFTEDRNKRFVFNSIAVLDSWAKVYGNEGISIQGLSDLSNKRIAILNGSVQQISFQQLMKGFGHPYVEIPVSSFTEAFSMVSIGVADAAIANHFFGDLNAHEYELQETNIIFNPVTHYFAIHPSGDSSIVSTIDFHLRIWKNTPQSFYYKTLQKHTIPSIPPDNNPQTKILIALSVVTLITFAILLNSKQQRILKLVNQLKNQQLLFHNEEDLFRSYFYNAPIGMFVADSLGRYTDVNPAACRITGYLLQELKNMSIADIIPESGREIAGYHFNQLNKDGHAESIMPYKTKSGEIRQWSVNAVKIEEKLIGFVDDITERMKQEQELLELPDRLEKQVKEKTNELNMRISELEHFREVTIEREFRMQELKEEIKRLKKS